MATSISIIIPVYKVERTLDDCVRSVLACCGASAQVILVDDGSPDQCPQMCDELALSDTRIEVIHRANGGLSAARNSGLDVARGEWVTFVDSDDVLEGVNYDVLTAVGADIVEFPVKRHWGEANEQLLEWSDECYDDATHYWLSTTAWLHCYAWNKVYRRELFEGVRFPEGRVFEDVWTMPMLLRKAHAIATTTQGCYCYRDNPQGITMTASGPQLTDLLEGNINAARVMGIVDRRHYAAMVNMQIDVYRTTRRILLPSSFKHQTTTQPGLKLVDRVKMRLPLKLLCVIHKWLIHRS